MNILSVFAENLVVTVDMPSPATLAHATSFEA